MRRLTKVARVSAAVTLVGVATVVVAGCGGGEAGGGGAASAGGACKVGVILPRSGTSSAVAEDNIKALRLLVKQVNDRGGAKGCGKLDLKIQDDQSTPSVGATALQQLASRERVSGIVGPFNSNVALAVKPLANRNKVPIVVSGATADNLLDAPNEFVFRPNDSNGQQTSLFVDYMTGEMGWRRVAIIHQQTDFGTGIAKTAEERIRAAGGTVVGKFDFQPGTSNFLSLVSRLKGLQFDGVITAALDAEATPLIRAMGQAGIRGTEVASFGMAPERVGKQAGRYAEGVRVAQYFDPEKPTNDTARAFVEAYRAEYGEVPTTYGTEGYNAGLMLVAAIEKAQSSDPQKIRDALAGLRDVPTAFGPLTFDEHNQVTHGIVIQQIKDTKPVTVATAG